MWDLASNKIPALWSSWISFANDLRFQLVWTTSFLDKEIGFQFHVHSTGLYFKIIPIPGWLRRIPNALWCPLPHGVRSLAQLAECEAVAWIWEVVSWRVVEVKLESLLGGGLGTSIALKGDSLKVKWDSQADEMRSRRQVGNGSHRGLSRRPESITNHKILLPRAALFIIWCNSSFPPKVRSPVPALWVLEQI